MKKNIIYIILFAFVFGVLIYNTIGIEDTPCILHKELFKMKIDGVVVKKYIDKTQHSYPIIEIKEGSGINKLNLELELSALFDKIEIDDVISKKANNDSIVIFRQNKTFVMGFNYGCVEKNP